MEILDKHIRVSSSVKYMLDEGRGKLSCSAYIAEMISYFQITGANPKLPIRNPVAKLEKRFEDLIKIIRCQERDYLKPLIDSRINPNQPNNEQLIKLANENAELRKALSGNILSPSGGDEYKKKYEDLRMLVLTVLQPEKFEELNSTELRVPKAMIETLIEKINRDYVL